MMLVSAFLEWGEEAAGLKNLRQWNSVSVIRCYEAVTACFVPGSLIELSGLFLPRGESGEFEYGKRALK